MCSNVFKCVQTCPKLVQMCSNVFKIFQKLSAFPVQGVRHDKPSLIQFFSGFRRERCNYHPDCTLYLKQFFFRINYNTFPVMQMSLPERENKTEIFFQVRSLGQLGRRGMSLVILAALCVLRPQQSIPQQTKREAKSITHQENFWFRENTQA